MKCFLKWHEDSKPFISPVLRENKEEHIYFSEHNSVYNWTGSSVPRLRQWQKHYGINGDDYGAMG